MTWLFGQRTADCQDPASELSLPGVVILTAGCQQGVTEHIEPTQHG